MTARRPWLSNLAAAVVSVTLCLGAIELVLQIAYRVRHDIARRAELQRYEADYAASSEAYEDPSDYYGKWDTNPAIDYNTYLGYISRASRSGNGYRTNVHHARYFEDFPAAKPPGEARVLVAGGSTAWGQGVRQEQLFTELAERRFRHAGSNVRVVSMGVTAYSSTQERILVENIAAGLDPDVMVLFSGFNDAYFGYSGKDILREQDFFKFRQVLARKFPDVAPPPGQPDIYPPEFDEYVSKLRYFVDVRLFALRNRDRSRVEAVVRRQSLPVERVLQTLQLNLETLADLARRRGFRLVFMLQPSLYSTTKALSPYERRMLAVAEERYVGYADYDRRFYTACRKELPAHAERLGYVFVDGDGAFAQESASVFIDHVHFGSRGNRLLGDFLHGVARDLLPKGRGREASRLPGGG